MDLESLRYGGASRERCYALFSRLAFRSLMNEYAPSADTTPTSYSLVTTRDATRRRWWPTCAPRGEFAVYAVTERGQRRAGDARRAWRSPHADRQGTYVPLGHSGDGRAGTC